MLSRLITMGSSPAVEMRERATEPAKSVLARLAPINRWTVHARRAESKAFDLTLVGAEWVAFNR